MVRHENDPAPAGSEYAYMKGQADSFRMENVYVRSEDKLHTVPVTGTYRQEVPAPVKEQWQHSLDFLRDELDATIGLVMQVTDDSLTVFLLSGEQTEVYFPGACFPFGMGSYCEETIGLDRFVRLDTVAWAKDREMPAGDFRQYCGAPLHWEDGSVFGTLCLLSRNEHAFTGPSTQARVEGLAASMAKDLELLSLRQGYNDQYEQYAKAMKTLLQYAPGGIFSYSAEADEQFSYISDNMLFVLGYSEKEFAEKFRNRFSLMVYEEDRERVLREIAEQIKEGPFDHCEYRIEKKDGTLAWVHDEGHIVADDTGKRWFYVVIVDITETVQAQERERMKFRSSMQALLAANPEAAGTVQFNLTRNSCDEGHGLSEAVRQVIRARTVDDLFTGIAEQILDAGQRQTFQARFERKALIDGFRNGRTSHSMDYRRKNDQGKPVWLRIYLNLLRNPDTDDVEGVAYFVDRSREKRRDEIMRIITSQEHDLIALLHLDAGTVEAYFLGETLPEAFRGMLSDPGAVCDLEQFRTNAADHWVVPEDRALYMKYSDQAYYRPLMDRDNHYEFVIREHFPEAPDQTMYRKFEHYYLADDRDTILVIESDVTRLYRRQQQELSEVQAQARFVQDIMDSITAGISVLQMPDADHLKITYVNQQMFHILGFAPGNNDVRNSSAEQEQMVREYTENAFSGVHPDDLDRVRRIFHDHFRSDYFEVENYRTIGADGRYYWIKEEVRLRKVTPDYRVFYATYYDVGEEVRLNTELTAQLETEKRLRQEAIAANAAKTDFLSRMSHDIRTPLNGILGMTYLAKEQDNPPKTADYLRKIDQSSKFLLGLINDILDMSRAESRQIELNPEPYSLAEFNEYLDAVVRPLCAEKGQQFILDEDFAVHDAVPVADKLRCNQIIFNLLSNAVKYTPEGGTITYRIRGRHLASGKIRIDHEISDTGIGMSDSFQKVLFDPFTQENRDDNSEKRGSGLGLAIVKKMVDRMGGTISVKSALGAGTTFHVTLTFASVKPLPEARPVREAAELACPIRLLEGKHILLCEDHPLNQEIAIMMLEQQGAIVEVAENGRRGLECFSRSPVHYYDAILMDIRMPVMDGYEATRLIRALKRADASTTPILAMTADAFANDVRKCLDAGMNGHLAKPIDPDQLYRELTAAMKKETKEAIKDE